MYAFAFVSAATFGLGTWQVKRYFWKVDLMNERKKQLENNKDENGNESKKSEEAFKEIMKLVQEDNTKGTASDTSLLQPSSLPRSSLKDFEGTRVAFDGQFLPEKKFIILGPRSKPVESESTDAGNSSGSSTAMAQSGYYLYGLFQLGDEKSKIISNNNNQTSSILVNVGWIPAAHVNKGSDESNKNIEQLIQVPKGIIKEEGVISFEERPGTFTPQNKLDSLRFFSVNFKDMWNAYGLPQNTPIVDLIPNQKIAFDVENKNKIIPLRKPLVQFEKFHVYPETHAGYAATWYGLSAAAFVFMLKLRKKKI